MVSASLLEDHVNWPGSFTVISVNPLFNELSSRDNFVFISDTLAYETTLKQGLALFKEFFLFLSFLGYFSVATNHYSAIFSEYLRSSWSVVVTLKLTNKVVWRLVRFSDLKHWMLTVKTFGFTVSTQVEVMADGAHVPDTGDRSQATSIADDSSVALSLLVLVLAMEVWTKKTFERRGTEILDFLFNYFHNLTETFNGIDARTGALFTSQTSLICLRAVAIETGHLLFDTFFSDEFTLGFL